jgi:hypothetical protein
MATVTVTLDPAQWNTVITALGEAPWRLADPIIREVARQVRAVETPGPPPPTPTPNAMDRLARPHTEDR